MPEIYLKGFEKYFKYFCKVFAFEYERNQNYLHLHLKTHRVFAFAFKYFEKYLTPSLVCEGGLRIIYLFRDLGPVLLRQYEEFMF